MRGLDSLGDRATVSGRMDVDLQPLSEVRGFGGKTPRGVAKVNVPFTEWAYVGPGQACPTGYCPKSVEAEDCADGGIGNNASRTPETVGTTATEKARESETPTSATNAEGIQISLRKWATAQAEESGVAEKG